MRFEGNEKLTQANAHKKKKQNTTHTRNDWNQCIIRGFEKHTHKVKQFTPSMPASWFDDHDFVEPVPPHVARPWLQPFQRVVVATDSLHRVPVQSLPRLRELFK